MNITGFLWWQKGGEKINVDLMMICFDNYFDVLDFAKGCNMEGGVYSDMCKGEILWD